MINTGHAGEINTSFQRSASDGTQHDESARMDDLLLNDNFSQRTKHRIVRACPPQMQDNMALSTRHEPSSDREIFCVDEELFDCEYAASSVDDRDSTKANFVRRGSHGSQSSTNTQMPTRGSSLTMSTTGPSGWISYRMPMRASSLTLSRKSVLDWDGTRVSEGNESSAARLERHFRVLDSMDRACSVPFSPHFVPTLSPIEEVDESEMQDSDDYVSS